VGQAGLDAAEGGELDESEEGQGAEARMAEGFIDRDGVEEDPGRRGEEEDAEVVPPVGDVAVVLVGDAAEDVEIEVLVYEEVAEAVEEVEVPGEDEEEEEQEAVEEGAAEAAAESGVDTEEQEEGEEEAGAGCSFAHEGDGEACPVEVPAVEGGYALRG